MTAQPCVMCDGPRDVRPRHINGVDMDICDHCWQSYGPPRHLRYQFDDPEYRAEAGWDKPTTYADGGES